MALLPSQQYCRTEVNKKTDHTHTAEFWNNHAGVLADSARFLINVPPTSADVERSFSLMGCMDTKLRHALPNDSRKLATLMMFNGDLEGRFD